MTQPPADHPSEHPAPAASLPTGRFRPLDALGVFVRGFAMGMADVVPGVSGGTIAFITGIYERFINALASVSVRPLGLLAKGKVREAFAGVLAFHWGTLIPIALGIGIAIVTMSKIITTLMEDQPGPMYAFFFGLILASAAIPLAKMKRFGVRHGVGIVAGVVCAWLIVGVQQTGLDLEVRTAADDATIAVYPGKLRHPRDLDEVVRAAAAIAEQRGSTLQPVVFDPKLVIGADPNGVLVFRDTETFEAWIETMPPAIVLGESRSGLVFVFICGAIAISAMILPGLSGSFLLLFLGQYHAVFGALHALIGETLALLGRSQGAITELTARGLVSDAVFVGVFLAGVGVGIYAFSRAVSTLLDRAHDLTMAVLTGIMLGALRLPGTIVLDEASRAEASGAFWMSVAWPTAIGVVIVGALFIVDRRRESQRSERAEVG